jgi:hypothetical protein
MVIDLTKVLNSDLTYGTKHAVIHNIQWSWTEFDGKYEGCRYWSEAAREQYDKDRKSKGLRHEHIVPRRIVTQMLFSLPAPTEEQVRVICETYLIGVVVTRDEDRKLNKKHAKKMPDEFSDLTHSEALNPWLRYKMLGIQVIDTRN